MRQFRLNVRFLCIVTYVLTCSILGLSGKEEGKKHGLGRTGGTFVGRGGQFITATPMIGCEQGYMLAGDVCERLEYRAGVLSCPKGTSQVGEGCVAEERVAAAILCPPGTRPVKNRCEAVETLLPLVECGKGWSLTPDGNQCYREAKGKRDLVCPNGFQLKHGICYQEDLTPARFVCPGGYLLQGGAKKHPECVASEMAPPEVFCPKGWVAEDGACVHVKAKQKQVASCPPGFAKGHKGTCERRISQDPLVTCPPGTVLTGGKKEPTCMLMEHRPVIPSCKKGYEFANNRCIKRGKHDISVECPKGYEATPQGKCFKQVEVEAQMDCPPNARLSGKHCLTPIERPVDISCSKGSSLVGGQCVSHEIVAPRLVCPDGFKKSKKNEGCELAQVIVAEPYCPPGSHLSGKHCITRNIMAAEATCKKGELTPKGCLERLKKDGKAQCPTGYKKHKGECSRNLTLPAAFVCPQGSILQERNQCLATTLTPPSFGCPKEFILDANNNCFLEQVIEPELACPVNTVFTNGQCYHAAFVAQDAKKSKAKKDHK